MENPCQKCILKGNCTEVCLEKTNYGILLKQSAKGHWRVIKARTVNNSYYQKQYNKLVNLLSDHKEDETTIEHRRLDAEYGIY